MSDFEFEDDGDSDEVRHCFCPKTGVHYIQFVGDPFCGDDEVFEEETDSDGWVSGPDLFAEQDPDYLRRVFEEDIQQALDCAKLPKEVEIGPKVPKNSLRLLAKALGKNERQIRRWCEQGLVPGARRTKGGHWRAACTPAVISQIKKNTAGRTRDRRSIKYAKVCKALEPFPDESELIYGRVALKMGADLYNLAFFLLYLHAQDAVHRPTKKLIALTWGIALSTLYRKFPKGRKIDAMINSIWAPAEGAGSTNGEHNTNIVLSPGFDEDADNRPSAAEEEPME